MTSRFFNRTWIGSKQLFICCSQVLRKLLGWYTFHTSKGGVDILLVVWWLIAGIFVAGRAMCQMSELVNVNRWHLKSAILECIHIENSCEKWIFWLMHCDSIWKTLSWNVFRSWFRWFSETFEYLRYSKLTGPMKELFLIWKLVFQTWWWQFET